MNEDLFEVNADYLKNSDEGSSYSGVDQIVVGDRAGFEFLITRDGKIRVIKGSNAGSVYGPNSGVYATILANLLTVPGNADKIASVIPSAHQIAAAAPPPQRAPSPSSPGLAPIEPTIPEPTGLMATVTSVTDSAYFWPGVAVASVFLGLTLWKFTKPAKPVAVPNRSRGRKRR